MSSIDGPVHPSPSFVIPATRSSGTELEERMEVDTNDTSPWSTYQSASNITCWADSGSMTLITDHDSSGSGYMGSSLMDPNVTERPTLGRSSSPTNFPPAVPEIYIDNDQYMCSADEQHHQPVSANSRWGESLAVPLQRCHSTRSSVDDGSSSGPPAFTPEVMYCDVKDCHQAFTGMYRRGNLGRHKRQKHREGPAYVCEDDTCAKEFQRKDARLKHYRRNHPELAVDSPLVRHSRASRPARRNLEVEFSNMSSWAT